MAIQGYLNKNIVGIGKYIHLKQKMNHKQIPKPSLASRYRDLRLYLSVLIDSGFLIITYYSCFRFLLYVL